MRFPLRSRYGLCFPVLGVLACSSGSDGPRETTREKYLGLETPTDGFQVRDQGATIPPGEDREFCEVAELPGDANTRYFVNSVEMANGEGSHHLILSIAPHGSSADAKLRAMNIGDRIPCVSAEMAFGTDIQTIGGIQHPYGKTELPPGIANVYEGGSRVVFDYHYYNATETPVEARSAFNFHLTDEADVKQLAGGFAFLNWTIDTPPGEHGSFIAECRFQEDAMVGGLTRHTHKWGRDFSTWFAGGPHDGDLVWTTPDFSTNTDYTFDEPVSIKAGDGFRFQCTYENTEDHPLRFGVKATDEMCILFGGTWSADGSYEAPVETCDITWVDDGGLGHTATSPGAFPPPSPENTALCLSGAGTASECTTCSCNSCADILIECFTDADCGAIVTCSTGGGDCEPVIEEHSSGVGLSRQVAECVSAKCESSCGAGFGAPSAADGGGN